MHKAFNKCLVHHFADDTNLLFTDKDPESIRKTLNSELLELVEWLWANRLSLNVAKTEFIVFKPPRKSLKKRITLRLDQKNIFESTKIKYLGLLLDSRLTWKPHIDELAKKLSRAIGLLYKIRNFSSKTILRSLYFGIFHSHLTYGLPVWGYGASEQLMEKIQILQKKALRVITSSAYHAHSRPIMKDTKILSLTDQRYLMTSSLMWDLEHNSLPPTLSTYFVKHQDLHHQRTRLAVADQYRIKKTRTKTHGTKSFQVQGTITLNEIKELDIYKDATSKKSFLDNLKKKLLNQY